MLFRQEFDNLGDENIQFLDNNFMTRVMKTYDF